MSFRTVLAAASLFIFSGCYTYHPYQYGHPGPYGAPPRGVVVPPANMPPGYAPSSISPGADSGIPRYGFDDGQGGGEADERVPNPEENSDDPNDDGLGSVDGDAGGEQFAEFSDEESFPAGEDDPRDLSLIGGGDDEFAERDPLGDRPPSRTLTVSEREDREKGPVRRQPNPYKFDDKGYTWLRGVVEYDKQTGEWQITYNPESDSSDRYGGTLTLANAQVLSSIDAKPDDVVLVEGEVDPDNPDGLGKPTFHVEHADLLVPDVLVPKE